MPKKIPAVDLASLFLQQTPLIDVRAPVEYQQGHLPGAINLPILNDEERALIGVTYKSQGNAAAVKLGHEIVSGAVREARVQAWVAFIQKNPTTVIYCFRGGQRSQIAQQWISEAGCQRPLIEGGYKRSRNLFLQEIIHFSQQQELLILSGPTGSGKTKLLQEVQDFYPTVQLEGLACHRGSAFGGLPQPQPTQINFENQLSLSFMQLKRDGLSQKVLVEDESRLIGRCCVPDPFFEKMRISPVLWLDEPLENRVENIFQDYITESAIGLALVQSADDSQQKAFDLFAKYKKSLQAITKKLGGLRTQETMALLEKAEFDFKESGDLQANKAWIERLLVYYYDPLYLGSLSRRQVHTVFKGSSGECLEYLKQSERK